MALTYDECVALSHLRARGMRIPVQRGALSPDVRRSVQQLHAEQRAQAAEPPKPWTLGLAARKRAESEPDAAATPAVRDGSGVPRPYATALQQRGKEPR